MEDGDDDLEMLVTIGKTNKRITVRRAKVNALCLCDIFTVARTNLLKKNLPVTRYRRRLRAHRDQQRKKRLLDQIKSTQDDGVIARSSLVSEAFARLRCRIV